MAIEKHKITFTRQLTLLWPCIFINVLTVAIYVFVIGLSAPAFITIGYFGFFFVVNFLPVLILHFQYLRENKTSILLLNKLERKLIYQQRDIIVEADFSEIVCLHYYGSYGKNQWYTFGHYEFCKILLSNGKEIIITSLMVKEVKRYLEDAFSIKAENHLKFLALIPKG